MSPTGQSNQDDLVNIFWNDGCLRSNQNVAECFLISLILACLVWEGNAIERVQPGYPFQRLQLSRGKGDEGCTVEPLNVDTLKSGHQTHRIFPMQ